MTDTNTPTPEQILLDRGAMPLHVRKSRELLATSEDRNWARYRDELLAFTRSHPDGGSVFLVGERGIGKTQMAVCMMRSMIGQKNTVTRRIHSVRYVSAAELFMAVRDAQKQGRELQTLYSFTDPLLLVIDDIHEQCGSDHERRTLTRIYDARLGYGRYTLAISNASRAATGKALGPSITSRHMESGTTIEVKGRNWREGGRADA